MKLDFSRFHGLFHWIGSPDCWRSYGGPRRHLELWWQYQRPGWDRDVDWEHPMTWEELNQKEEGDEPTEHPPLGEH